MSNEPITPEPTQEPKKMSASEVIQATALSIETGEKFSEDTLKAIFNALPENTRFSGSSQQNILPANISTPFNVMVNDNIIKVSSKLTSVTTIIEGSKTPTSLMVGTIKMPVSVEIDGKRYSANILCTKENFNEVANLLKNKVCKGITTEWEGLQRKDGSKVAKLELVPVSVNKIQADNIITEQAPA